MKKIEVVLFRNNRHHSTIELDETVTELYIEALRKVSDTLKVEKHPSGAIQILMEVSQ